MALYAYGVTASEVLAERLASTRSADATTMDASVQRAASRVNAAITRWGMSPASITEADTEQDWSYLREMVMDGAAAYYLQTTGGNVDAVEVRLGEFHQGLRDLAKNPSILTSYVATDGANTIRTHTVDMDSQTKRRLLRARPDPSRRTQWTSL